MKVENCTFENTALTAETLRSLPQGAAVFMYPDGTYCVAENYHAPVVILPASKWELFLARVQTFRIWLGEKIAGQSFDYED